MVFLSACDVGRSSVSAGDESSGVVSAFLGLGTSTLVASVLPVPDALAAEVAARFHRSLAGGARPAAALVGAVPAGAWSPFVAFGSG
jgi:CHAT domain-containing protein